MRRSRLNPILLAAPLALSLVSPLCADQVVYFVNGKAIMVKSVEKGDKFTVLEMDGGGKMGVPTDQIARIEDYVLSAPAAPQFVAAPAPVVVQAPVAAPAPAGTQAASPIGTRVGGIPANLPPAAPMVSGPGVGGRPTDGPGRGVAGLRAIDVSGGAAPSPVFQRQASPQSTAGPAMGGPAGAYRGSNAARPNFNPAGRRAAGRGGMGGRGRGPDMNRYMPPAAPQPDQNQPPAHGQEPVHPQAPPPEPPPPVEEDQPTATEPEVESQPPTDPENEKTEPETPPPAEGETPDDSTGGAS